MESGDKDVLGAVWEGEWKATKNDGGRGRAATAIEREKSMFFCTTSVCISPIRNDVGELPAKVLPTASCHRVANWIERYQMS